MSVAIIYQAAMAYDLSLARAWQAFLADVPMSWVDEEPK